MLNAKLTENQCDADGPTKDRLGNKVQMTGRNAMDRRSRKSLDGLSIDRDLSQKVFYCEDKKRVKSMILLANENYVLL